MIKSPEIASAEETERILHGWGSDEASDAATVLNRAETQTGIHERRISLVKTLGTGALTAFSVIALCAGVIAAPTFFKDAEAAAKAGIAVKVGASGKASVEKLSFVEPPITTLTGSINSQYNVGLDVEIINTQFGVQTLSQGEMNDLYILLDPGEVEADYDVVHKKMTINVPESAFSVTADTKTGTQHYVNSTGSIFKSTGNEAQNDAQTLAGIINSLPWVTKKIQASDIIGFGPVGKANASLDVAMSDFGDRYTSNAVAEKCGPLIAGMTNFQDDERQNIINATKSQLFEDGAPEAKQAKSQLSVLMALHPAERNKIINAATVVWPKDFAKNLPVDPSLAAGLKAYTDPQKLGSSGVTLQMNGKTTNFTCKFDKHLTVVKSDGTTEKSNG